MSIYGAEILNKTPLINLCTALVISVLITVVICVPAIFVLCIIHGKFNFKSKALNCIVNCTVNFITYFICAVMMYFAIDNVCNYTSMYNYQVKINDNISLEEFINNNSDSFEIKLIDNEQNIWELKNK